MSWSRPVLAIALLVGLTAGGVAIAAWTRDTPGAAGSFAVEIVGPQAPLFVGNVSVPEASALSLLRAACERGELALETEDYPGLGTYVRAIGGHRASGPSGWVYEVQRNGTWVSGDRSAAKYPLHDGEALRWSWTGGGGP